MKKFTTELSEKQGLIYHYLSKEVTEDGSNLKDLYVEISECYEYVPENIADTFNELTSIEQIEVIYFITKKIMRKNQ